MQKHRLIKPVVPAFAPVPRRHRQDGWTAARQRKFIDALADTGSVKHAAARVGMSSEGAYYLRRQPGAEEFAAAWLAALDHGIRQLEDIAMERAIHGVEVPIYSCGKHVGSRTLHNDRLLMFMLRNRADERFSAGTMREPAPDIAALKLEWQAERDAEQAGAMERARAYLDALRERLFSGELDEDEDQWGEDISLPEPEPVRDASPGED